jgi:trehalose-phosphatase
MASITQLIELSQKSRNLFIGLDRDGTLVPYAASPKEAIIAEPTRQVLTALAFLPNLYLAIVSARSAALLKEDVDSSAIVLAGNYGMEILFPNGKEFIAPDALKAVPELKKIHKQLACLLDKFPELILEDHGYSLCLHWHTLKPGQRKEIKAMAKQQFSLDLNHVYIRTMPTSFEFLPHSEWDKGNALEAIAAQLPLPATNTLSIYIGDTDQDEPGYLWVNKRDGASIKVAKSGNQTAARYRLPRPSKVTEFLQQVLVNRKAAAMTGCKEDEDDREKKIEAAFKTLQADYASGLLEKIDELESIVEAAANTAGNMSNLTEARMQLHRMKGTIGSYGFADISSVLGEIEASLQQIERFASNLDSVRTQWTGATPFIAQKFARARALVESRAYKRSGKS